MKICRICNLEKDNFEFPIRSSKDNVVVYRSECKSCKSDRDKLSHQDSRIKNPQHAILISTKRRAKVEGLEFNLEEQDIIIPEKCPVLGIELQMHTEYAQDNSPSIDRLIPSKGYVKGNCFIISYKANRMKQENSLEDLEKIIKYIKERI